MLATRAAPIAPANLFLSLSTSTTAKAANLVTLAKVGAPPRQSATMLLRHCAAQQAAHLRRWAHPAHTESHAGSIDCAGICGICRFVGLRETNVQNVSCSGALPIARGGDGIRQLE